MTAPRELLVNLLSYIKEQAKRINPQAYKLTATKGLVKNHREIVGLPGVEFNLQIEGDHIWLRIPRLSAEPPPKPPQSHKEILRINSDPSGPSPIIDAAALLHQLNIVSKTKSPEEREIIEKQLQAKAAQALESYSASWNSWAEGERPRRKTISLYTEFFSLMHQMEAEETSKPLELIWGIGISSWLLKDQAEQVEFEYPVLTQAMEITIDENSMALDVRPRATETRIELDAFVECQLPGATEVEKKIREHLARHKEQPVSPFDASSYADILKLIAGNIDSEGAYQEVLEKNLSIPRPGSHLVVTDAWVVIARAKTVNYLFEDLKRLQEKLESGCDIPQGPVSLVTPPSNEPVDFEPVSYRGISSRRTSAGRGPVEELFFPLPYNDEQVTIVQHLKTAAGVTVQGPPGTGKTHTIANIICHYLACGLRVLVTSKGDAALSVLQAKIPIEVRPLTVALLANDREGVRQFQASIEAIQHQVSQLNPGVTRQEIARLQGAIDQAHTELTAIDNRIVKIAVDQLSSVEVDGVQMRAQKLAELVITGGEQYGWFDDEVSLSPNNSPPLSEDEAGSLRESRRMLGEDIVYISAQLSSADDFLPVSAIAGLHEILVKRDHIKAEIDRGELLSLKADTPEVLSSARALLTLVEETLSAINELDAYGQSWPMDLRARCRQLSFNAERAALESLLSDAAVLMAARADFLKTPVEFPDQGLDSPKTLEAVARAADTGKPFGFVSLGASSAKELIAKIRIAGRVPLNQSDWIHIQKYVKLHSQVHSYVVRWNALAEGLSLPRLSGGVSNLRNIESVVTAAKQAHQLATKHDDQLRKKSHLVFEKIPIEKLLGDRRNLESVREQLIKHLTLADLSQAATHLSDFQDKLAGKSGPVSDTLRSFLTDELGNPNLSANRVAGRYAEIIAELRRIASLSFHLANVNNAAQRIETAGAPKLAARIRGVAVSRSGEDKGFPSTWRQAWNWARMKSHLEGIEAREELVDLASRRREIEKGLAQFYREIVAKTAWLSTRRNATPLVLSALAQYATAIRRIGQGTGPNATRYRRDARNAMRDAAGAVPCWIMNHARISEAMPADIGTFDLVIVDEASQSDLWALPAILRGKKILVVGDDKQVSPDGGFIAATTIQALRDRFLKDQPFAAAMTPEKSLYDLAAAVFAADQVMLREHFRCVPPVIAYSNRIFYKDQILPLRIPTASERIDPPLVDIYVERGSRDAHDRNEYEAQVIAEEIAAILSDDRFAKRSIGVVSLLGAEQAKYIDSVVSQRCDPAELRRRRFLCGDARTFQGSERDIMFLSLVVDSKNYHALSGNIYDQRFNVAASRARDRMYLVRSVTAVDLSQSDLRRTLLTHFENPHIVDQNKTQLLADLCESGFERQVFSELSSRGYRVIPQVRTGAFRIDMVVEGLADVRLAIECDGDEFHGPDRWQYDMNRQRVLERAGWSFWRCFASTWLLHKDEVLNELLTRLQSMGIEPLGAVERMPSLVEKRTWKRVDLEEDQGAQAALAF